VLVTFSSPIQLRVTDSVLLVTTNPQSHSHSHSGSHRHVHPHGHPEAETSSVSRIQRLAMFLEAHFGEVELHMPDATEDEAELDEEARHDPSLLVQLDDADAQINLVTLVGCSFIFVVSDSFIFFRSFRLSAVQTRYSRSVLKGF
jgi:hypothetical protein